MRVLLIMIIALMLGCSGFAPAREKPFEPPMGPYQPDVYGDNGWKVLVLSNAQKSQRYRYRGCSVTPWIDGAGVDLTVYGPIKPGVYVYQFLSIRKGTNGMIVETIFTIPANPIDKPKKHDIFTENAPDLFEAYCAPAARRLPMEAQALFHGYYGIGKKTDQ